MRQWCMNYASHFEKVYDKTLHVRDYALVFIHLVTIVLRGKYCFEKDMIFLYK